MSPEQLNYLKEHLPYTLQMLRYTHRYLMTKPASLEWNTYYEAFAVNARNFDRFLTNNNKGNFKSNEFTNKYKHQTRKKAAEGIFQRIENQVFHFGKRRPIGKTGKVDSRQIDTIYKWLESEISTFYDALPPEYQLLWDLQIADPHKAIEVSVSLSGPPSTSTSVVSIASVTVPYR
jgi:hypothetical protein